MKKDILMEWLLDQDYYVIDSLPRQVKKEDGFFFFEVEEYLFSEKEIKHLSEKFVRIVLKALCYFEFSIRTDKWIETSTPFELADIISKVVFEQKGCVHILLSEEKVLIEINGGDLFITVINCNDRAEDILKVLATSEGLFWRKVED